ncbi:acyl carrier protein [Gracilibacillus ureilyticus]|uniref:Acyl carrier protein n=1 Tax=Gracilibacillus ureilyticus TaxID=531814 RepID=A0A1H9M4L6_9BACI|nr:acyl carrier protein [Gracilibacillus ureilyticus]SER18592.1 acyl carrier protein [Gracilibacillus ureilyticus]
MTMEEFIEHISRISNIPSESIEPDSSFKDDIGIDSLQMVNLLIEITEKTNTDMTRIMHPDHYSTPFQLYRTLFK